MEKIEFKYHPNIYTCGVLEEGENTCQCCGKAVSLYYPTMYCIEDVDCLCLECIANGKAAEKFDGTFSDYSDEVEDKAKRDELNMRTPGYISWQGERWRACCDDFCAYLGDTNAEELQKLNALDEALAEYNQSEGEELVAEDIAEDSHLCAYLFQCLHCKKYKISVDCD